MNNLIDIQDAAKQLNLTVDELRPLLKGHYKNPDKIKHISLTKWNQIVNNYQGSIDETLHEVETQDAEQEAPQQDVFESNDEPETEQTIIEENQMTDNHEQTRHFEVKPEY